MVRVIYSFGNKFGGHGLGTTAYQDVRALHQRGWLQRLLCGSHAPTAIPAPYLQSLGLRDRALRKLAVYDPSHWIRHLQNVAFDRWASRRLEAATVFHVWSRYGLASLRRARALGMLTAVQLGEAHPHYWLREIGAEHARWGSRLRIPQASLRRQVAEFEAGDYVLVHRAAHATFVANGVPAEKCVVLPGHGADLERYVPPATKRTDGFRALFAGEIHLTKGIPYLLDAWRRLRWLDAELWLVGRVHRELRPILRRHRDTHGIRLFGHVTDPLPLYQQADCLVMPSILDASPKVVCEALACGLPVIATSEAGSMFRDGVEGFIVPRRDAGAVAQRLEQLRADDRMRRDMGQAARRRAEQFSWDAYGEQFADLIGALGTAPWGDGRMVNAEC